MKRKLLVTVAAFLLLFGLASAQRVNMDSASLVNKIAADKEKLVKLKNSIPDKEKAKKQAAQQAQESADDNQRAASKLGDDPQDKKLARKANSKAGDAKSDARKARRAAQDLEDLNKDIQRLTEKIEKEQKKLNKLVVIPEVRTQPDSTHT